MVRSLIILGNDKIGRRCYSELVIRLDLSPFELALDCSTNVSRICRLVHKRKMPLRCLLNLLVAEISRRDFPKARVDHRFFSNENLHTLLLSKRYDKVYLFRAGLIINMKNLSLGSPFYNVHSADIPEYAGLCSIYRALKDKAFYQNACLHRVTSRIDDPSEIMGKEPYKLLPDKSYRVNEDIAYDAGIRLLVRALTHAL